MGKDNDRVFSFCVGDVITLTPYNDFSGPVTTVKSESFRIDERKGKFVTIVNEKTGKRIVTRVSEVSIPKSEVIGPHGYCPFFAYQLHPEDKPKFC